MTVITRWHWRMRMPSGRTEARRSCRRAAFMPPRRAARSCSAAVNMKMSSRTFRTASSASAWRSARRHWMRSICRSRPAPVLHLGIMIPTVCSGPLVPQRRALSPLSRTQTLRLGTAPSALITSSSVIPIRALMRHRRRQMAAAAIRCIITGPTVCALAATRTQMAHRRRRAQSSPAVHAAYWS